MASSAVSVGHHLRAWRQRRRWSQLDLALEADISQRHLSFVESGRSAPTRDMVLRLADRLEVPLRERNVLLLAAGYAPVFAQRPLDDPALKPARDAIDLLLKGHEPFPALAIDRHWTLVAANAALPPLLAGVTDPSLMRPPVNVLRLTLHPPGLSTRITNFGEWRSHLLDRLRQQIDLTADYTLTSLMREVTHYPAPDTSAASPTNRAKHDYGGVLVPLELATEHGQLSFFSTTTVFGTPVEVTLAELALESLFPANAETAEVLRRQSHAGTSE